MFMLGNQGDLNVSRTHLVRELETREPLNTEAERQPSNEVCFCFFLVGSGSDAISLPPFQGHFQHASHWLLSTLTLCPLLVFGVVDVFNHL